MCNPTQKNSDSLFVPSIAFFSFYAYLMHYSNLCKGNGMCVRKQFLLTIERLKEFFLELYETSILLFHT